MSVAIAFAVSPARAARARAHLVRQGAARVRARRHLPARPPARAARRARVSSCSSRSIDRMVRDRPAHRHAAGAATGHHLQGQRPGPRHGRRLLPRSSIHGRPSSQVENYLVGTSQIAQTTLRSVLGQHTLDELLAERDKINEILQGSSTSRPSRGASRSRSSRSRTSSSRRACSGRWRARPRPSASGAPRSSAPRASSRPPRSWPRPPQVLGARPGSAAAALPADAARDLVGHEHTRRRSSRSRSTCCRPFAEAAQRYADGGGAPLPPRPHRRRRPLRDPAPPTPTSD